MSDIGGCCPKQSQRIVALHQQCVRSLNERRFKDSLARVKPYERSTLATHVLAISQDNKSESQGQSQKHAVSFVIIPPDSIFLCLVTRGQSLGPLRVVVLKRLRTVLPAQLHFTMIQKTLGFHNRAILAALAMVA